MLTSKQKLVQNLDASGLEIPVDSLVAPGFAPSQHVARHCASGEPGFVGSGGDEEALDNLSHLWKPGIWDAKMGVFPLKVGTKS